MVFTPLVLSSHAVASSDGGFSAPSTAPTFAAGSAGSHTSDAGAAAPAPAIMNGDLGSPVAGNNLDIDSLDVQPSSAQSGAGDATGPAEGRAASGFAAIKEHAWGTGRITTKEDMDSRVSKFPRGARSVPPAPTHSQESSFRYRKVSPRSHRHDLEELPQAPRGRPRPSRPPRPPAVGAVGAAGGPPNEPLAGSSGAENLLINELVSHNKRLRMAITMLTATQW